MTGAERIGTMTTGIATTIATRTTNTMAAAGGDRGRPSSMARAGAANVVGASDKAKLDVTFR